MSFGNPMAAVWTALVAVPLLVLLYMLKLRRLPVRISSTFLWESAYHDLEANAPWQRLRLNSMFFLQLLLLALLLLAMAEPRLETDADSPRLVIVIDASASMNAAREDGVTRLDEARATAASLARRWLGGAGFREIMVIAFGRAPSVACGYESDLRQIEAAIESITPTDETGDLEAAMTMADAFAAPGGDGRGATITLISDGAVSAEGIDRLGGAFRFEAIDTSNETNRGVVTFAARRDREDPVRVRVLASVVHDAIEPAEVVVTLLVDEAPVVVRRLTLPAAGEDPGEAELVAEIDVPGRAMLRVRIEGEDALVADDTAALVLPAPRRPRVAVVHPESGPDPFLLQLLDALDFEVTTRSDPVFDEEAALTFDAVVFDRRPADTFPALPSLWFAAAPLDVALAARPESSSRVLSWDRTDPALDFVTLDAIVCSDFTPFVATGRAEALVEGRGGPLVIAIEDAGLRHVLVAFELSRSNWPLDPSCVIFLDNVLGRLAPGTGDVEVRSVRAGEPIVVRRLPGADTVRVRGPEMYDDEARAVDPEVVLIAPPRHGLYELEGVLPSFDRLPVSVVSRRESDLRGRSTLDIAAGEAAPAGPTDVPSEFWPLLGLAGLVLICVEWLMYLRWSMGRVPPRLARGRAR